MWGDYDNDGYLDLYVVNDFGRKTLYHNNRNGTFTDVTGEERHARLRRGHERVVLATTTTTASSIFTWPTFAPKGRWYAETPTVMRYMFNSWRTRAVWVQLTCHRCIWGS